MHDKTLRLTTHYVQRPRHSCYAYVCCHGVVDPSTGIKKRGKLVSRLVNARTNTFLWRGTITLLPSCPPYIFIWAFSAVSCVGSLVSRMIPQLFLFSIILFYFIFFFCFFLFWCFRIIRAEVRANDGGCSRWSIEGSCKVSASEPSKKVLFRELGWVNRTRDLFYDWNFYLIMRKEKILILWFFFLFL